jgi:hypothetical protein
MREEAIIAETMTMLFRPVVEMDPSRKLGHR